MLKSLQILRNSLDESS